MPVSELDESKIVYPGLDHSLKVMGGVFYWDQTQGWIYPKRAGAGKRQQSSPGQGSLWTDMAKR
jgi:hypothetical protein